MLLVVLAMSLGSSALSNEIQVWDTGKKLKKLKVRKKKSWELLKPGTNQGYFFKGDPVVENRHLISGLLSKKGCWVAYAKEDAKHRDHEVRIRPVASEGDIPLNAELCKLVSYDSSKVCFEVVFRTRTSNSLISAVITIDGKTICPRADIAAKSIRLECGLVHVVVPTLIGDDLTYGPNQVFQYKGVVNLPAENLVVGLLPGRDNMLTCTWLDAMRKVRLAADRGGGQIFKQIEFEAGREPTWIGLVRYSDIWHEEPFDESYLEKDVASKWERPFEADRWRVQWPIADVLTSLHFKSKRHKANNQYIEGNYIYPAWFSGDTTWFRLTQKIPPKGKGLVYPLGPNTDSNGIDTPLDIMMHVLDKDTVEAILDWAGESARPRGKVPGWTLSDEYPYVDGTYSCRSILVLRTLFESGREVAERELVQAYLNDWNTLHAWERQRINEYTEFASDMEAYFWDIKKKQPHLAAYIAPMESIVVHIGRSYEPYKEITTEAYVAEQTHQILLLTRAKNPENLPAYLYFGGKLFDVGVVQIDVLIRPWTREIRKMYNLAGYGCAGSEKAVPFAQEIRRRIRQVLQFHVEKR